MKKLIRFSWLLVLPLIAAGIVWTASSRAITPLDRTVLLPNPDNCYSYFSCSDGVPILMFCPDGLHFNRKLGICDWPKSADCRGDYGARAGNTTYCYISYSYAMELVTARGGVICGGSMGPMCFKVGVNCPDNMDHDDM